MRIRCLSKFSSSSGTFEAGEEAEVTADVAAQLLRESSASFEVLIGASEELETPEIDAMSTETATGLVAPDRRARGGKVR